MADRKYKKITIALAGNPNSGKTTTFNSLTGARQKVANYPGVTVEKKEGRLTYKDYKIKVVDLPGTYSLTAYSIDELIARNFILNKRPQLVVDVMDAANLERHLYLAVQFIELEIPMIITLNMIDTAKAKGFDINVEQLSKLMGIPIIPTAAKTKKGLPELLEQIVDTAEHPKKYKKPQISYGEELDEEIDKLQTIMIDDNELSRKFPIRWLAIKLLENDSQVIKHIKNTAQQPDVILDTAEKSRRHIKSIFGEDAETILVDRRYGFVEGAYHEAVKSTPQERVDISEVIDRILTHRALSLPIFFTLMWMVYNLAFAVTEGPTRWLEGGVSFLGHIVGGALPVGFYRSLIVDGIIGGVGNVLVLLPPILVLFLAIAILEDSGYMSRVAFIMDRIMHHIGLHGKSVIPMLMGFGCAVPAIMATRTLASKRDRIATMLIIPFMSCGAKLPVYAVFITAFFKSSAAGNVLFSIYILGILMAAIVAKIFQHTLFTGESTPFVMELPPYRLPTAKGLLIHMWQRSRLYIKKAGKVILLASVVLWFMSNISLAPKSEQSLPLKPADAQMQASLKLKNSLAGYLGRGLAPFLKPIGLGDWRVGVALFSGFVAKEVVISTMATLYSLEDVGEDAAPLREAIAKDPFFTPLRAYTLMVFVLLYLPCMSTIAIMRKETGGWTWPAFTMVYTTAIAWIVSFAVYHGGSLFL